MPLFVEELDVMRFNAVLIVSVLLLGLTTGCQNEEEVIETPPMAVKRKTPSPANPQATPSAAPASPGQASTPASTASPGQANTAAAPASSPKPANTPVATASPARARANTPTAPANTAAPTPKATTPAQSPVANNAKVKQSMAGLKGYLPAAVKALQANDVATAKRYAQAFSTNWNQKIIQFTVKKQSQATYDKIATGVTNMNNTMKPATPDKAKTIAAIQSLSQSVDEYAKSP